MTDIIIKGWESDGAVGFERDYGRGVTGKVVLVEGLWTGWIEYEDGDDGPSVVADDEVAAKTAVDEAYAEHQSEVLAFHNGDTEAHDPDDVADLVAHDAAAGLPGFTQVAPAPRPGTLEWAARIVLGASPADRANMSAITQTVLLAVARVFVDGGDYRGQREMIEAVVEDLTAVLEAPDPDEFIKLYPAGRTLFYEGDDPREFAEAMTEELGFNPRIHPDWNEDSGWQFHCPAYSLKALYQGAEDDRWVFGS